MYQVDDQDTVVELSDLPQSSVGAPIPMIVEGERRTIVAYYVKQHDPEWDCTTVRVVGADSEDELVAIVRFDAYATMFGPPNDEAFSGHPLAARGLRPYGFFEVLDSSWIRSLEKMNSVHPYHRKAEFLSRYRHFVLSFHDTTLECIASGFDLLETRTGSVIDAIAVRVGSFAD